MAHVEQCLLQAFAEEGHRQVSIIKQWLTMTKNMPDMPSEEITEIHHKKSPSGSICNACHACSTSKQKKNGTVNNNYTKPQGLQNKKPGTRRIDKI